MFLIPAGSCLLNNAVGGNPPLHGLAAMLTFTGTSLLALEPIRRRFFELFRLSHCAYIMAYAFAILHSDSMVTYCAGPACLYFLDILLRIWRRCKPWELVSARVYGNMTVLELTCVSAWGFTHRPGQFCFLQLPSLSVWQWHPFSITHSTTAENGDVTLTFAIKAMGHGSWTARLNERVKALTQNADDTTPRRGEMLGLVLQDLDLEEAGSSNAVTSALSVRVDGPFGVLATDVSTYKRVVLVGGGIGVTPLLSILQDLSMGGNLTTIEVVLVWTVRTMEEAAWALPVLTSLLSHRTSLALDVRLFVSAKGVKGDENPSSLFYSPLISVSHGRPDVHKELERRAGAQGTRDITVTLDAMLGEDANPSDHHHDNNNHYHDHRHNHNHHHDHHYDHYHYDHHHDHHHNHHNKEGRHKHRDRHSKRGSTKAAPMHKPKPLPPVLPSECVVLASGPEGMVMQAHAQALRLGYDFKHETFLL